MSVAVGILEYRIDNSQVVAFGVSHTADEMTNALINEVHDKVYDCTGNDELVESLFSGISETGFTKETISQLFSNRTNINDWEIGEAYAHAYLEENLSSLLPWSLSRDIKKPGSSLPGADIVGFCLQNDTACFLFGEVKTSSDQTSPPSLVYGSTGLKKQLEDLCEDCNIVLALVKYLGYRLLYTKYWGFYKKACQRFLSNNSDVQITGVMIRDIEPNERDLSARATSLCPYCINGRQIQLVSIYLPNNAVSRFVSIIREEHERRVTA